MPAHPPSTGRPSTRRARSGRRPTLAVLLLAVALLVAGAPAWADTTGFPSTPTTYAGFDYGVPGHPATADKPQSKLWFADGSWWAVMISPANAKRVNVFELMPDHTWRDTGATVDERTTSTSDVLYEDGVLYTASRAGSSDIRVNRLRYDAGARTWQPEAGFPVSASPGGSESVTLALDSLDRLWITYTRSSTVWVQRSTGSDHRSWTAPFTPGTVDVAVNSDDLSAVVSLGDRIGVMWSNQLTDRFSFAVHRDTAPDDQWTLETPLAGSNLSDDHVNLKTFGTDAQGRTFAVVKTSADEDPTSTGASPLIVVLVRSAAGTWSSSTFGTIADDHTRPMLVVDETHQELNVFATGSVQGGTIYRKKAPLSDLRFAPGRGEPFVTYPGASINNATSTKDPVNADTGLVVLAAAHGSVPRYFHTELALGAGSGGSTEPPPPPPPSGGIAFRSASSAENGGTGSITVPTPSGVSAGDVLLASVDVRGRPRITAPTGWQLVRHDDGGSTMQKATYWKAATAGEPAGYTFALSSSAGATGTVSAYSGVSTTAPVDVHSGLFLGTASRQITAPAVTTTVPGARLVGLFATATATTIAPPPGMTERAEATTPTSRYKITGELADAARGSTGSTGPQVATSAASGKAVGQLVALRPAGSGGGGGDGGGTSDTTAPSAPGSVTATATSSTSARVAWVASTDDTGVTGYEVRRDGVLVTTTTGTSWSDAALAPATTYSYAVVALDAAGNRSPASAPASVTTPAAENPPPPDPEPSQGIAFRAASAAENGGADSVTVAAPSGTVAGDVLLASIDVRGRPRITPPTGWQLVRHDDGGTTMQKATYWKAAAAGDPATWTFGFSYGAGATALMSAWSGVSTASPVDGHSGLLSAGSTSITAPAVTTTVPGTRLVGLFGAATATTIAPPSGMTERAEATTPTSTYKVTGELADAAHSATGSTGPRTATAGRSTTGIGQLVALRPAG